MDKATLNTVRSLRRKHERIAQNRFIVEGEKSIAELAESSLTIERMYYVSTMAHAVHASLRHCAEQISVKEMDRISQLSTSPGLLAIAKIPSTTVEQAAQAVEQSAVKHGLVACQIQDPGNLGTLIRSADWFGFGAVLIMEGTVDPWNTKTVQASMGSIFRIPIVQASMMDLPDPNRHHHLEMQGTPYTEVDWKTGWIWVGSESHGFGRAELPTDSVPVHIPRVGSAESLNAGVAASIVCAEIARKKLA